jgi:hypothetical protein
MPLRVLMDLPRFGGRREPVCWACRPMRRRCSSAGVTELRHEGMTAVASAPGAAATAIDRRRGGSCGTRGRPVWLRDAAGRKGGDMIAVPAGPWRKPA